ncbi:NTP hydrolase family protein [Winogradskyella pacifica]|uniref:NTP hydrolase family protein n=1 Tax=Winogradskyella pacifica TaxID=664642 RepID=A0A3D9N473_9FLAO|nr:nucleoside-triphosphatase [Winogradskyella pacifica]REE27588.1 NTP hydrolase family protein [Winogradskyella pacifica]
MIYILTGAVRTGKTTALLEWCKNRDDVDGLLCPDNAEGKRYFLEVKSKNEFEFETEFETEAIIEIGNFKFLESGFEKANDYLLAVASKNESQYLIIDELGKLELKKEGLHASAEKLISNYKSEEGRHLILVVRNYLLDAVLTHYSIVEYEILEKKDFENL